MYDRKYLSKNPFDEHLPGKEDRYWANDVVKKGKSFLYDPDMEADHHYTEKVTLGRVLIIPFRHVKRIKAEKLFKALSKLLYTYGLTKKSDRVSSTFNKCRLIGTRISWSYKSSNIFR